MVAPSRSGRRTRAAGLAERLRRRLLLVGERKAHDELAAFPFSVAVHMHGPPVHVDERPHQGETDAQPAPRAVERPL